MNDDYQIMAWLPIENLIKNFFSVLFFCKIKEISSDGSANKSTDEEGD